MIMSIFQHYTSIDSLNAIIENGTLRFSDFRNTNDHTEFKYALDFLYRIFYSSVCCRYTPNEALTLFKNISETLSKALSMDPTTMPYLFCLCDVTNCHSDGFDKNDGLLSMWRAYTNDSKGVAIEFKETKDFINNLKIYPDTTHITDHVRYYGNKEQFFEVFDSLIKKYVHNISKSFLYKNPEDAIRKIFMDLLHIRNNQSTNNNIELEVSAYIMLSAMFFKHQGFHEEREYRAIVMGGGYDQKIDINTTFGLKKFIEIDFDVSEINHIIIGPGLLHKNENIKSILNEYLASKCLKNIKVIESTIPYLSFL